MRLGGCPSHQSYSCLSPSFPSGVTTFHSASPRRRCATPAAEKPQSTPKKKFYVASSTRRTSGIGSAPSALGGQTLVAFYNVPSPLFKLTRLSNGPGFSTSVILDGRGTLSWSENSNACARRWGNSKFWTPVHLWRRTGRKIPGREVWWRLNWPKPCEVRRGGLLRQGYEGCSLEKCVHLPIRPHTPAGTMNGSQLSHLQPVSPFYQLTPSPVAYVDSINARESIHGPPGGNVLIMYSFRFVRIGIIQLSETTPNLWPTAPVWIHHSHSHLNPWVAFRAGRILRNHCTMNSLKGFCPTFKRRIPSLFEALPTQKVCQKKTKTSHMRTNCLSSSSRIVT